MGRSDLPQEGAAEPGDLAAFRAKVMAEGAACYRDLPWRNTRDPYAIWISEAMLQQTQTSRVDGRWQRWLERFPSVNVLAAASQADVLAEWQGLGYNRRALAVHRAARAMAEEHAGEVPCDYAELLALPGIGPATAAGIRAFAYELPGVYLETNVRAVFLHELFPNAEGVPDRELVPLVTATCPPDASNPADTPRTWYYACLDYGYQLKSTGHNAARRSAVHARQKPFEGSRRQKRAELVRQLLAAGERGLSAAEAADALTSVELAARREPVATETAEAILSALAVEGFCAPVADRYVIA